MGIINAIGAVADLHRKLRAVTRIIEDPAATEHEKANARSLGARLQRRLKDAGAPAGDWTDTAFRLGQWAKDLRTVTTPAAPKGNWTDTAHRIGKAVRLYTRRSSD